MESIPWGGTCSETITSGAGDQTGIVAFEQVVPVSIEVMAKGTLRRPSEDCCKSNVMYAKLPRRLPFCIVRAAAVARRSERSRLVGAICDHEAGLHGAALCVVARAFDEDPTANTMRNRTPAIQSYSCGSRQRRCIEAYPTGHRASQQMRV